MQIEIILPSVVLGIMLFFSFAVAPVIFKVLKENDARKFVRSLGIKNQKEWRDYCNSGNKPDNIPTNPWEYYSKKRSKNEETI